MARSLILRFTKVYDDKGQLAFDSQLIQINGPSGVHIETDSGGFSITTLRSMTGRNFVSCSQDYFAEISDFFIPHPGIGQAYKLRLNKLPLFGTIIGDIEDLGDPNPDDPLDMPNAFADINEELFMDNGGSYFFVKN